jgi:hypothetical protein
MQGKPRYYRHRCPGCGRDGLLSSRARRCADCLRRRQAEANRVDQRRRRREKTLERRQAAGLVRRSGEGWVPCDIACACCGRPFRPERTTGRYCSTRCRVAACRERKKAAGGSPR